MGLKQGHWPGVVGNSGSTPELATSFNCTLIIMNKSWNNVPGKTFIEITLENGIPQDDNGNVAEFHVPMDGELVIEWVSSGYYSPKSMYGGPDNLGHPAEGDDERTLKRAYYLADKVEHPIPLTSQKLLFTKYLSEVYRDDPSFSEQTDD